MHRRRLAGLALALTLHVFGLLALIPWAPSTPQPTTERTAADQAVTPVDTPEPPPAPARTKEEDIGKYLPRPTSLQVRGFGFDVSKIRARWNALFPFITAPPALEGRTQAERSSQRLMFADPMAQAPPLPPAKPRLVMTDAAVQQLLDRTWTRRDRWSRFDAFVSLVTAYHPDDGRLPGVIQAYVAQNSLQPYEDTTFPDPRRWALLALAADHQDFVDFIAPYVREHPRTRTATELLFLLDALLQGSRETLVLLLETNPRREMWWTRQENWQAYELFASLRDYYRELLDARGLSTTEAVSRKYDDLRLEVLSMLRRLTPNGYRASDAAMLMGAIRWRQGERDEAVRLWREMKRVSGDSHAGTASRILAALPREGESLTAEVTGRIDAILAAAQREWVTFQFDRLRQFGYGFSMY